MSKPKDDFIVLWPIITPILFIGIIYVGVGNWLSKKLEKFANRILKSL